MIDLNAAQVRRLLARCADYNTVGIRRLLASIPRRDDGHVGFQVLVVSVDSKKYTLSFQGSALDHFCDPCEDLPRITDYNEVEVAVRSWVLPPGISQGIPPAKIGIPLMLGDNESAAHCVPMYDLIEALYFFFFYRPARTNSKVWISFDDLSDELQEILTRPEMCDLPIM